MSRRRIKRGDGVNRIPEVRPEGHRRARPAGCCLVPLSGFPSRLDGDLAIGSRTFEIKARARGCRHLYRWLGARHFGVIVTADREEPLLVLRLGDFLRQCAFRDGAEPARPKLSGAF